MDKRYILHVLIGNMNCGGIENVLMQLYRNIDRNKFQFDFVVHDENENFYEQEILHMGGKLYRVPYISISAMKHIKDFYNLLKQHPEYKIIHIHTTYAIMIIDAAISKLLHRKVIIHSHNSSANRKRTILHKLLKHPFNAFTDYRIACSIKAAKWMFPIKQVKKGKIYYWKNPIELDKFSYNKEIRKLIRKEEGVENNFVIVNVGRLSYQKNQTFLLYVFSEVLKIEKSAILWLIGSGEDENKLQELSRKLDVQRSVKFMNTKDNVFDYLNAADCFCFPSLYEGLGVALIEAECTNLPIVMSDTIPDEVNLSSSIHTLSLKEEPAIWARKILSTKDVKRKDLIPFLEENGFNIKLEISHMQSLYNSLYKE